MGVFNEIGLSWNGEEYTVAPDRVMGLIEVIEDVITLEELTTKLQRMKIAKAYFAALRYAGCRDVTVDQIYVNLFDPEKQNEVGPMVSAILMMMIPPEHLKASATPKKPAAKASAKKKGSAS